MKIRIAIFILFLFTSASLLSTSYRRRHLDGKVKASDLIVLGIATAEGAPRRSDFGPFPQYYKYECRIVVQRVLWPENKALTNDIVIPHLVITNWPANWWNYSNTTGVFFFTKTPIPEEQKTANRRHFEQESRSLPGDIQKRLMIEADKIPIITNTWSRLDCYDDWFEPITNMPAILEQIRKIKK